MNSTSGLDAFNLRSEAEARARMARTPKVYVKHEGEWRDDLASMIAANERAQAAWERRVRRICIAAIIAVPVIVLAAAAWANQ